MFGKPFNWKVDPARLWSRGRYALPRCEAVFTRTFLNILSAPPHLPCPSCVTFLHPIESFPPIATSLLSPCQFNHLICLALVVDFFNTSNEENRRSDFLPTLAVIFAQRSTFDIPIAPVNRTRAIYHTSGFGIQHGRPELVVTEDELRRHESFRRKEYQGRCPGSCRLLRMFICSSRSMENLNTGNGPPQMLPCPDGCPGLEHLTLRHFDFPSFPWGPNKRTEGDSVFIGC